MHCFSAAVVRLSAESSVEALVSRYKIHFDKTRQLEEHDEEILVAENDPTLGKADSLIKRVLNAYILQGSQQAAVWEVTFHCE